MPSDKPSKATSVYIALGANLGNPLEQLDTAVTSLDAHPAVNARAISSVYRSVPHGDIPQPDYYNAVLQVETTLNPEALLAVMRRIETDNGRERTVRWGARTLDLDMILYADWQQQTEALTLPHPRAHMREFVVKPLYDLNPALEIPPHGKVADLLNLLPLHHLTEVRHGTTYHH